jgi:sorting nexin-29
MIHRVYVEKPTLSMVYNVIKGLKKSTAPIENGITAELPKYEGRTLWRKIYNLIIIAQENEDMPADWQTAVLCPTYKKGDKLQCKNYRGISLLNVTYKIFTNIITQYPEIYTEEILGDYQCRFTTNQILTLRQIIENTYEFNVEIHQLFTAFQHAYNSINCQQLYTLMAEFNTPTKIVNLVKLTMRKTKNKVQIGRPLTILLKLLVDLG